MKAPRKVLFAILIATPAAFLLGCGDDHETPVTPIPLVAKDVVVTGRVTEFVDGVPADGGATITVASDDGGTELLLFPSLFTYPRPSPETVQLYEVVRQVEVGDWVRAEGRRTDRGIELHELTLVKGP